MPDLVFLRGLYHFGDQQTLGHNNIFNTFYFNFAMKECYSDELSNI